MLGKQYLITPFFFQVYQLPLVILKIIIYKKVWIKGVFYFLANAISNIYIV